MYIEFPEWLPDLPPLNNPGLTVCDNVLPGGNSYLPFIGESVYSDALDDPCQGAFSTKDGAGNSYTFAGDANKLYQLVSAQFSDVSKSGGYNTSEEEFWFFTRFNELLIATNFADPIQAFNVDSGSAFDDLAETAPKARYVATLGSFVIAAATFDAIDGNKPFRVRWCGLNDVLDWTVSDVTLADYQDLDPSDGWITGIVAGDGYATIFQERAITRMTFIGSPAVFQFTKTEAGRGTRAPYSLVPFGNNIAYLGLDGWYIFDGNQSIAIGENKINRYFFEDYNLSYPKTVFGVSDVDKQILYFAYAGQQAETRRANKILCYNYSPNAKTRWTIKKDVDLEFLFTSISEGFNLDTIDAAFNTNLDTFPFSLDSRQLTGDNFVLSGFDSSHRQVSFESGDIATARIETAEYELFEGYRTEIRTLRPVINEGSSISIKIGERDNQSAEVSYTPESTENSVGDFDFRSNARFHRFRIETNNFSNIQGIHVVEAVRAGRR
jgi:hypothetical protein